MAKSLDLGCGAQPRNPFGADEVHGIDVREDLEANIRQADLVLDPIPYANDTFDYLSAFDFIEHVPRLVYAPTRRNAFIELMNEVHRVLKPSGVFLSSTPAHPHAVAFRDPTHVNIITEETFPLYFDDQYKYAAGYGFRGAFKIRMQKWEGPHLVTAMEKVCLESHATNLNNKDGLVSIFMPVFNGSRYLRKTITAIQNQSYKNFEVIAIDDCSTDASPDILQEVAKVDPRVKVFRPDSNLGSAPKAINFALSKMSGDYFVYTSQDDLYSADWLESMVNRAAETGADAVIPEVVFFYENKPELSTAISRGGTFTQLTGREAVISSLDNSIAGNALWNARLIRRLGFETFGFNSDEFSVKKFFLNCNKVVFSGGTFLYRQDNPNAITKKISASSCDIPYTGLRVARFLREHGFQESLALHEERNAEKRFKKFSSWLDENRATLSPEQILDAQNRLNKYTNARLEKHAFDPLSMRKRISRKIRGK